MPITCGQCEGRSELPVAWIQLDNTEITCMYCGAQNALSDIERLRLLVLLRAAAREAKQCLLDASAEVRVETGRDQG